MVCLEDINVAGPTPEDIRRVAEATCTAGETIYSTWFDVTPDKVKASVWAAGDLGTAYKGRLAL